MSRKDDLEAHIRESYQIVRQYEETLRDSDRPEERARAQRVIREQWELVKGYLPEYQALAGDALPKDVAEIAVSAQVRAPGSATGMAVNPLTALPAGPRPGWALIGAGVLIVAVIVAIAMLVSEGLRGHKETPTAVVSLSTSTFTVSVPAHTPVLPSATSTSLPLTAAHTPVPPAATLASGISPTRVWDKDGMVMVYVPAGEFLMGSNADKDAFDDEKPQHTVHLDAFWIDQTEVTNAQYEHCVADGACQASYHASNSRYEAVC